MVYVLARIQAPVVVSHAPTKRPTSLILYRSLFGRRAFLWDFKDI